jgi:hypothetical protein
MILKEAAPESHKHITDHLPSNQVKRTIDLISRTKNTTKELQTEVLCVGGVLLCVIIVISDG